MLVPGLGYPSVNIRLFEPAPVRPEQLLEWGMLDEPTLDLLAQLVRGNRRGFHLPVERRDQRLLPLLALELP